MGLDLDRSVNCGSCNELIDEREAWTTLCGGDIEFAAGHLCAACGRAIESAAQIERVGNELLEWAAQMGGWEAPVWKRLEQLVDGLTGAPKANRKGK